MAIIEMNLARKPFDLIRDGSKVVDIRVNDEKRQTIKIGDTIRFNSLQTFECCEREVVDLQYFKSFSDLFDSFDSILLGARNLSKEQFLENAYTYNTKKEEEKYGVVAIVFKTGDSIYREKLISREIPFEGRLLKVRKDRIIMPCGKETTREWIEHPGACAIVYVDEEDNILLEKQYRYPFGRVVTEIPAGKLNTALEHHKQCAIREFEEETGLKSLDMTYLGQVGLAMAYSSEVIYIYYTHLVEKGTSHFDDDEMLTLERVPFDKALQMCNNGEIIDSKTVIGINLYNNLIRKHQKKTGK